MQEAMNRFLETLASEKRKCSRNTIEAYSYDLSKFQEFLQDRKLAWQSVDSTLLETYIAQLRMAGYVDATRARKVSALRSFFRFLAQEGTIIKDPAESLYPPYVKHTSPKHLSEEEVSRLLAQAAQEDTPVGQRNAAILELLYFTGLSVSELTSLDALDINFQDSCIRCQSRKSEIRIVRFPPGWLERPRIKHYLTTARPHLLRKHQDTPALLVNNRGQRLIRQTVWNIIKTYGQKAGIRKNIAPNTLRRSLAIYLLQNGESLHTVQELLGHSRISTTQIYTLRT